MWLQVHSLSHFGISYGIFKNGNVPQYAIEKFKRFNLKIYIRAYSHACHVYENLILCVVMFFLSSTGEAHYGIHILFHRM